VGGPWDRLGCLPTGPRPRRLTGLIAIGEQSQSYLSAWDDLRARAEEYREIDGERTPVLARNIGVPIALHGQDESSVRVGRIHP
jgi:hypothetical protein